VAEGNPEPSVLRQLLRRERLITLAGLLLLCALAWLYLANGAGMAMDEAMPSDGRMAMDMVVPPMARPGFLLVLIMWFVMMLAMMLPSAAPAILLYERVQERAAASEAVSPPASALVFAAGYLLCWFLFSTMAASIQLWLGAERLIEPARLGLTDRTAMALILLATGAYQLSPLKSVCLSHCRSPASFFARHWRPGWAGAVRLGLWHGAFCVACCWALMLLLFVGGVMNLAWVAVLSLLVLAEKLLPFGATIGRVIGVLLIAAGVGTLLELVF